MSEPREHVDNLREEADRYEPNLYVCLEHITDALEGIVDRLDDLDTPPPRPSIKDVQKAIADRRHPALDAADTRLD